MGIGPNGLVPAVTSSPLSGTDSAKGTAFSVSSALSEAPPAPDTWRRPIWVQTAVMIKKLIVTAIKSMNGTRLLVVSRGFFLPELAGPGAAPPIPPAIAPSFHYASLRRFRPLRAHLRFLT